MTGYLFEDGAHVKFKVHCPSDLSLTDRLIDLYEPVELTVGYISMPDIPLLISEKGFTVSAKWEPSSFPKKCSQNFFKR